MTSAKPLPNCQSTAVPFRERALGMVFGLYKSVFSPVLHAVSPSRCLYLPTCSEYSYTAVSRFGMIRGSWMAMRRLLRCHPWAVGGLDPVPENHATAVSHAATGSTGPDQNTKDHLP